MSITVRLAAALTVLLSSAAHGSTRSSGGADASERGDVPGWVLVTVMTAGIVVAISAVAAPTLRDMFTQAIGAVTVAGP